MRNREMFIEERESVDSIDWPESGFEVDDEAFAKAIADGRGESRAA